MALAFERGSIYAAPPKKERDLKRPEKGLGIWRPFIRWIILGSTPLV